MPQPQDETIDLDRYFHRIGYQGERAPTLAVLQALQQRHAEAIAFENLNPLLGWAVALDLASLQRKLVVEGRGGYCFEHNLLFAHALTALGFSVTQLAARVLWNATNDAITPRSHMLLRIDLDDTPYIVDVGFGGLTQTRPLRMTAGVEQATTHEPFRLLETDGDFVVQAKLGDAWKPLYRFDLQPQHLADYQIINWYLANHPQSHFVTGLIAARPAPGRRYALRNNELAVHTLNGSTERRVLRDVAQLRAVLEEHFLLTLPDTPALDAALVKLIASNG